MKKRPEYNLVETGKNLRRLREKKQLTVEDVRQYMGLGTVQAVYRWEWGRNYPTADALMALAELYDVNPQKIMVKKVPMYYPKNAIQLWYVQGMDYVVYI
ncbi:MAG: helix-turn-helix transcriptional regulator [Lachnospiraceae bacterium]|nr:helix-turn-helix transcriptional regulator [Lachnospiraceae bacterium]